MPETLQKNYQSFPNMDQEGPAVKWKTFYLHVSGKPSGAHLPMVKDLKKCGQREVFIPEDSDYILLFCVISSRVGTDVGEALENVPRGKEVILVVMHHTYDPDYITAESRRLVEDPNVVLVVDCLFHEGQLLQCDRNDNALSDIKKFLRPRDPVQKPTIIDWLWKNRKILIAGVICAGFVLVYKNYNYLRNFSLFLNGGRNV